MPRFPKTITVAVITGLTIACLLVIGLGKSVQAGEAAASPPKILGVDEFMKNVDRHRDKVSLEGVVSGIAPEQQAISLIDRGEFQACGVTTCSQLSLSVQWGGPMPAVSDLVRIEGQVQEVKGKLMFVAQKLDKAPRP